MELDTSETTMSNNADNNNSYNSRSNNNNNNTSIDTSNNNNIAASALGSNGSTSNVLTTQAGLKSNYDTDVVRLIGQHLVSLGLKQTVDLLLKETGLSGLDHPIASKLQQHILAGEWDKASLDAEELAHYTEGDKKSNLNNMRILIAEQKFLESIEDNQHIKALKCLRLEITPITDDIKRVQNLAILLMCKSIEEVRLKANWHGKGIESRQALIEKIQRFIPPLIMLPPKRLSTLLSQAVMLQRERCILHNTNDESEYMDLKSDHICTADQFPLQTRQELNRHKAEVWYCKFSNDGTKLATGGLGGKVEIWELNPVTRELTSKCVLDCSCYSITCLSWSPNDVYLLACGSDDRPGLWIWNVNKEEVHNTICSDDENITTCSWHMSGDKFAAASIKGNFNIYDLDCNRKGSREGIRVQCLSFLYKDPNVILAADSLNRIKSYAIGDMSLETDEEDVLNEKHPIMSFTVDREDRYIAVNLMEQGVHLWDFRLKTLLRMFAGVSQRELTIYSSFSSPDSTFLASGSEDGNVYIYHIHKDRPVAILHGHTRCVNCVSWNPKYPELLVSVSDDRVVRLWAPRSVDQSKDGMTGAESRK